MKKKSIFILTPYSIAKYYFTKISKENRKLIFDSLRHEFGTKIKLNLVLRFYALMLQEFFIYLYDKKMELPQKDRECECYMCKIIKRLSNYDNLNF